MKMLRAISSFVFLRLFVFSIPFLCWSAQQVEASGSRLCISNIGNATVKVAVIYSGAWGGWLADGWWEIKPRSGFLDGCTHVPENDNQGADFHYLAFRQQGPDGRWYEAAFDVKDVSWTEDGSDTVGGSYTLVPRSTHDSRQLDGPFGKRDLGGTKFITCVPKLGTKKLSTLKDHWSCSPQDMLALFGTQLYTPTDGGLLQINDYDVYVRTSVDARLFDINPSSSGKANGKSQKVSPGSSETGKPDLLLRSQGYGFYFMLAHLLLFYHPLGVIVLVGP
ncbi:hypothetical protein [Ensifer adhaerens]|uniref:hypothetical protein n=1 Tax=Ensifer adhaerens TaxID=106592 RepID=UPI000DC33514|nr:hypothetical protein [Ensifer adhaerens]RAS00006.1 hypothetical protein DEU52_14523 [Ensifer adhaerens]